MLYFERLNIAIRSLNETFFTASTNVNFELMQILQPSAANEISKYRIGQPPRLVMVWKPSFSNHFIKINVNFKLGKTRQLLRVQSVVFQEYY